MFDRLLKYKNKEKEYYTLKELEKKFPGWDFSFLDEEYPHRMIFKSPDGEIDFTIWLVRDKTKKIKVTEADYGNVEFSTSD